MQKRILTALFVIAGILAARAQGFEGVVTWKVNSEITDPATKAKLEEAQKKMKDPANQAKMKEMKAKMEDPQFKAMMDANPQMKAQMEAMMKMMESGDVNSMFPTGFVFKVKNGSTITRMEGGMMDKMEVLYMKDKKQSYQLHRENKTYATLPTHTETSTEQQHDVKVTKTTETMKVLEYTCTKYIAESTMNDKPVKQIFWTTTAIKDFDMKSLTQQRFGSSSQSMFYDKIEGVPLKMEMSMPEGKMVMEATSIKKQSLPAADFVLPADYKEVDLAWKH